MYGPVSNENNPNSSSISGENASLAEESFAVDLSVDHLKDSEDLWKVYLTRYSKIHILHFKVLLSCFNL